MSSRKLTLLCGLILLAALTRLLPHPPNFGPLGGMALLGAALLPQRWLAFLAPFLALYLSDLLLNNTLYAAYYDGFFWGANLSVYLGFGLMVGLGLLTLRGKAFNWGRLGLTTVAATLLFFLVTNFGSWLSLAMYPKTAGGLLAAYVAGLPFLMNSLLGNLIFSAVLFGAARYVLPRQSGVAAG